MENLAFLQAVVNSPYSSLLFLVVAMGYFTWVSRFWATSKVQEWLGYKDRATQNSEKSRALCSAHTRPVRAAWQSLRHAHRQAFPQNLAQAGAVGRDLSQGKAQDRQPRRVGRQGGQKKTSSTGGSDDGDGGGDGGEPPRRLGGGLEPLLNYEDFGLVARLAPGTVKNLYCRSPELLPPAIHIPGHRGPLWRPNDVSRWFEEHVTTPATVTPAPKRRKAGRPRIAAGKGGAS
jgi:hypothetical protein